MTAAPFGSRDGAVRHLISTYDAVNAVIRDLTLYKECAVEAARKLGMVVPATASVGGDDVTIITSVPHLQHVSTRLNFVQ